MSSFPGLAVLCENPMRYVHIPVWNLFSVYYFKTAVISDIPRAANALNITITYSK